MNEFRRDPLTGQVVIVATERDQRPNHFQSEAPSRSDFGAAECPFCAHQMDTPPPLAHYGSAEGIPWEVCVVPNLYPVLSPFPQGDPAETTYATGISGTAHGFHEVVVESSRHVTSVESLTSRQLGFMALAYRERMQWMQAQGMAYVLSMKNSGPAAGASLPHCHSQIFGLPFVPERVQLKLDGAERHFRATSECRFCQLIEQAERGEDRLVARDSHFVAWCPYASRFAYEVWIAPREHGARFETTSDELVRQLGVFLHGVLGRLAAHARITAFNLVLHSLPFDTPYDDHYHWHIEIIPRIANVAGFEWGSGIHINTVAPERAAVELRCSE